MVGGEDYSTAEVVGTRQDVLISRLIGQWRQLYTSSKAIDSE